MVESETVAYINGGNSSKHTVARSVSSSARSNHKVAIRVTNLIHWLSRHIRHEDWLVCKMVRPRASKLSKSPPPSFETQLERHLPSQDIENTEHTVLQELLNVPSTLRLIDELFVECHHFETYRTRPHSYRECASLYDRLTNAGVWVHDYY